MKKRLAKMIGSLLLISMVLTSVFPVSAFAADGEDTNAGIAVEQLAADTDQAEVVPEAEPAAPATDDNVPAVPAVDDPSAATEDNNKPSDMPTDGPAAPTNDPSAPAGENNNSAIVPVDGPAVAETEDNNDPTAPTDNKADAAVLSNTEAAETVEEVQKQAEEVKVEAVNEEQSIKKTAPADENNTKKTEQMRGSDVAEEKTDGEEESVTAFVYDGADVKFIKTDLSGFGMWAPKEGTTIKVSNGKVHIHYLPTQTAQYAGFSFGSIEDVPADADVQPAIAYAIDSNGAMDIVLDTSYCGNAWAVTPIKPSFTKGSWTTGTQYYLAVPAQSKIPADYSAVEAAIASVPEDLTVYTEESVANLQAALDAVVEGKMSTEQETVDGWASAIAEAVSNLKEKGGVKKFAYDGEKLNAIDREGGRFGMYEPQTGSEAVLSGDKVKITFIPQNTTIFISFYLNADIEMPETWTTKFDLVDGKYTLELDKSYCGFAWPIAPVKADNTSTTTSQYYLAIPSEDKLEVEPEDAADYSKIESAKAKIPKNLSIYTDESVAALQKALDAVKKGLTADDQATVDAWAKDIEAAIAGLVVKETEPDGSGADDVKTYTGYVKCDEQMFPVAETCTVIQHKDGTYDAVIKMKSKDNVNQTIVCRGKAADAPNKPDEWVQYSWDENGVYTFTLKNIPIGVTFDLASYSVVRNEWYDRHITITFEPDSSDSQNEQQEAEVLAGGTAAIDNSTILPDGTYTPDYFEYTGGTGRATITCRSVTVVNGQAYATIVFSSSKYGYVKAAGGIYYPTIEGDTSVFTIPVRLNQNNTIIGMTTAMSAAHEITYSIYVYIAAAETGEENENALKYLTGGEEVKLEHAKLLKLFRFDNGVVRVEIDRTKDTVLDPEKLAKEAAEESETDKETQPEEAADDEEGAQTNVKTVADYAMELYQEDVVKYLVVPEDVEIPAGLEKQLLIIKLPKETVYVSSEGAIAEMEKLDLLDLVKATGITEENCTSDALKQLLKDEKVVTTGTVDDLDYTELVKANADLVIGAGEELLPKEAEKDKTSKDYQEQYTKVTERMALLDIPMILDRSADEEDEKGQLDWLKLYGILFGKEAEADELIKQGN